jgi:hypothetical protein
MNEDIQSLSSGLLNSKSVLLVLPQNPSVDATASALALSLVLSRYQKSTQVVCPTPMTAGHSRLVGVDKVAGELGSKNLVINFDVPEEAIEKVSYNYDDKNRLYFVVEPASGFEAPGKEKVNFSYSGIDADYVLFIGVKDDSELGKFKDNEDLRNHASQHHLTGVPVYSSLTGQIISEAGYDLDQDSGSNLLYGIDSATRQLTQNITPEILEIAARALRAGATRQSIERAESQPRFMPPAPVRGNQNQPFRPKQKGPNQPRFQPQQPRAPMPPRAAQPAIQSTPVSQPAEPIATPAVTAPADDNNAAAPQPAPDWFEPKIYKGSSLL